jgi:multiple sugar transport system permease protein
MRFVGLSNLVKELSRPVFLKALGNSLLYTLMATPISITYAFLLALLLDKVRMKVVFRAVFFMPVITSSVAAAMIWVWLFTPDFSPINFVLHQVLHIPGKMLWLGSTKTALFSLVIMSVWQSGGYGMVLFLAGLNAIPASYYEAATIDGANSLQQTLRISIPLCTPALFYSVITSIISCIQVFNAPYLMTGGGPVRATYTMALHIYDEGFKSLDMGRAAAASMVLLLLIVSVTAVQFVVSKKWVYYEGGND